MALKEDMQALEARLKDAGFTVADLCRAAKIARSTWDRWQRGETEPNTKTWRIAVLAAEQLIATQEGGVAA
jgi:transcriptional regulator with XRE-family HTH domain